MKRIIALAAIAAACLAACAPTKNLWANQHVSVKAQAVGVNFSPATGTTAGYASATGDFTPVTTPDGKILLTVSQPCGQADTIATFSNLNSKAQASATSTTANGVNSPTMAFASGDFTANGAAARILALGGGVAPTPQALTAYQNACPGSSTALPSAPATSVVPAGSVAPKQ